MKLFDWLKPEKPFVIVAMGKIGVECFADPDLNKLNPPTKKMLKSFLEGVIETLK